MTELKTTISASSTVNHWEYPTYMTSVEDRSLRGAGIELKNAIWDAAKETIEQWTGMEQKPISMYGTLTLQVSNGCRPVVTTRQTTINDRIALSNTSILRHSRVQRRSYPEPPCGSFASGELVHRQRRPGRGRTLASGSL